MPSPLDYLVENFAPNFVGMNDAKRAVLMSMASGNDGKERQRSHTLLYGPPGTGKTGLLRAAIAEVDGRMCGPRSTAGGLTIDFRNGKIGAIGKVHHTEYQLLAIDEMEKMEGITLDQLLVAMETGSIPQAGGAQNSELGDADIPAHVRIIAAVNDTSKLSPELMDRFDYKIHVPAPTPAQAHHVVKSIANEYMQPPLSEEEGGQAPGVIKRYLDAARAVEPKYPAEERRLVEMFFKALVDSQQKTNIQLRPYVGIMRGAYTLARINHTDIRAEYALQAFEMMYPEWRPSRMNSMKRLLKFRAKLKAESMQPPPGMRPA